MGEGAAQDVVVALGGEAVALVGSLVVLHGHVRGARGREEALLALEVNLHIRIPVVELKARVLAPLGIGLHDVCKDAASVDLGLAQRQVLGVVLTKPVDKHVKAPRKAAVALDYVKSVVDHFFSFG